MMRILITLGVTLFSVASFAADAQTDALPTTSTTEAPISMPVKTTAVPDAIITTLKTILRDYDSIKNSISISPAVIDGLYEVAIGMEVLYISADGQYFMTGSIHNAATREDITASKLNAARKATLSKVDEKDLIVFAPKGETKFTVDIFTDVDCPYCSKIHNEVKELNAKGVKVRYFAYPRAGIASNTYKKMVSVWCAKDQQQAMTDVKAGKDIPETTCNNPVIKLYALGQEIGVTGTPAIVLSNGEIIPGYVPADRLITHLESADL
jgi:thiol:disulfide interchange protein DsbC